MKRDPKVPLQRYEQTGVVAVRPQAFFDFFPVPESRSNELIGDVEIVDICGPLKQHGDCFMDNYDAIRERVAIACERQETKVIVMRFDSPGGDAQGVLDAAVAIATMCQVAGKPLYAYIDGQACSAAYALACVAERIVIGRTAFAGSVGVAYSRTDISAANAAEGIRIAVVASGARKLDGNPTQPITDDELRAQQELVDAIAGALFEHVAAYRPLTTEQIAAFDGRVFSGQAAIVAGLADEQAPFAALLESITTGEIAMTPMEKARAALTEASKSDDAEVAAQARKALAAMDGEGDEEKDKEKHEGEHEEPDGDEPKAEYDDKEEPDGDEEEKPKPKEKHAARGVSSAAFIALAQALTESEAKLKRLEHAHTERERTELLASRPDLPAELVKTFDKLSLVEVKSIVAAVPRASLPLKTTVTTLPVHQGKHNIDPDDPSARARLPPAQQAKLDAVMGLATIKPRTVKMLGSTQFIGVPEDYMPFQDDTDDADGGDVKH